MLRRLLSSTPEVGGAPDCRPMEAIFEARVTVAGLGLVSEVQAYIDGEADKLTKAWLATYALQIKTLTDDRKESYRQIIEMSTDPQSVDLAKPESCYEATNARENEKDIAFPTWKNHLLSDKDGKYPAELNEWERAVVEAESKRTSFQFWYRNPQQPGQSSLGIAYMEDEADGQSELGPRRLSDRGRWAELPKWERVEPRGPCSRPLQQLQPVREQIWSVCSIFPGFLCVDRNSLETGREILHPRTVLVEIVQANLGA